MKTKFNLLLIFLLSFIIESNHTKTYLENSSSNNSNYSDIVVKSESCTIESSLGKINLSEHRNLQLDYSLNLKNYKYKANFCGSLISGCGSSLSPAAFYDIQGICLGDFTTTWGNFDAKYLDSQRKEKGMELTFKTPGGHCMFGFQSLNSLVYNLECDESFEQTSLESIFKKNQCTFVMIFKSKKFCMYGNHSSFNFLRFSFYFFLLFFFLFIFFWIKNCKENIEDGFIKNLPLRGGIIDYFELVGVGVKVIYSKITKTQTQNEEF